MKPHKEERNRCTRHGKDVLVALSRCKVHMEGEAPIEERRTLQNVLTAVANLQTETTVHEEVKSGCEHQPESVDCLSKLVRVGMQAAQREAIPLQ